MTGAVRFCLRGAPALVVAIEVPPRLPATVELPHEAAPASFASVERVLAYVAAPCGACQGAQSAAEGCRTCRGQGSELRPLLVRHFDQLFGPRRWQLELHPWAHAKGAVT